MRVNIFNPAPKLKIQNKKVNDVLSMKLVIWKRRNTVKKFYIELFCMEFNTYREGIISLLYIQEIGFELSWLSQQVQRFFIIQIGKQKQLEQKQWPAFHYDKRGHLPFLPL
ncbi:hypothetical protein LguiB_014195 [Lonicera macranthoides]